MATNQRGLDEVANRVLQRILLDDTRRGTAGPPMTYEESIAA
jgi:hypothetical protein